MVGFGSSLRMSRRRGWEDAYLDYQSLRLLLTQIEAVYEEEDWERGVEEGEGDLSSADGHVDEGWKRLLGDAWRATKSAATGNTYHRYNGGRRRRYPRVTTGNNTVANQQAWATPGRGGDQDGYDSNAGNTWASNDYFDYSPERQNRRRRKRKDSHGRALDRGGWRSPGVTDYRDELFLVSDEDVAYGYWDGDDDDDEWEDEEGSVGGNDQQYYGSGSDAGQYDSNVGSNEEPTGLDDHERFIPNTEGRSDPKNLTPGSEKLENEDATIGDDYSTPSVQDSPVKSRTLLQTPSQSSQLSPDTKKPGPRVQFSDSPGVLEAGYETFAAAAARSGIASPGGPDGLMMTVGSPTEEQAGWLDFLPNQGGWLDFLPNFLSRGKQQKAPMMLLPAENDPLLLKPRESSEQHLYSPLTMANPVTDDATHRNSYFSEGFRPQRSSSSMSSQLASTLDGTPSRERAELKTPFPLAPSGTLSFPTLDATSLANNMLPTTPMTPPMTPVAEHLKEYRGENDDRLGGFGVSLKMIPFEATKLLRPSSPRKQPSVGEDGGMSQFYSFQNESFHDDGNHRSSDMARDRRIYSGIQHSKRLCREYDGGDEDERNARTSNMISFYGGEEGHFSIRSPTKVVSRHHHPRQQQSGKNHQPTRAPSSPSDKQSMGEAGRTFVLSLLFGRARDPTKKTNHQGAMASRSPSNEHVTVGNKRRVVSSRKKRAAAAARRARRKRARFIEQKKRQQVRRRECVPEHLRAAHARAAAITERFRGLLRAEVEKVILFANSRLGELSNTIGSLRYSSYEETHKEYPSLADGGMHRGSSSSDSDGGASLSPHERPRNRPEGGLDGDRDIRTFKSDSSKDETKKQIMLRDRLRICSPMFQKADFLGEDFSLLSAVDEADAYAAVGVELMHLLKYVCVNIIAVRKICKKHDRLLSNRMLGGYYHSLTAEAKRSHNSKRGEHLFPLSEAQPQFGGTLSNPTASQQRGYIFGIYDTKIQHIANSTTMQTVSCSLAIALSDFEASQSRSARLGLFGRPKSENVGLEKEHHEVPSPKYKTTTSRLRDAVSYPISGQCFRGDDESTIASQDGCGDENASTSSNQSNIALTRLQFVVTSIFGLREAARFKSVPFENYSSRLFMVSSGPNVMGDGLDGCSRQTLDFLCAYNPDAAYTLDMETINNSLKVVGWENDRILGGVMVASLAAAAKGYDRRHVAAAMSINPQATGEDDAPLFRNVEYECQNVIRLNTMSMMLSLANYYIIIPTAHVYSTSLGSRNCAALIIGVANISSIISSVVHSLLMSKPNSFIRKHTDVSNFRLPLVICSACALVGNILYSYSLTKASLGMALVGRLLVGFGSADVLNRQLLVLVHPQESINTEIASVAKMSMIMTALALLLGSLVDIQVKDGLPQGYVDPILPSTPAVNFTIVTVPASVPFLPPLPFEPLAPSIVMEQTYRSLFSLGSIGYVMSLAWAMQLIGMLIFFDSPESKRRAERETVYPDVLKAHTTQEEDFDSDTETHDQEKIPPRTETNPFIPANTQEITHGDGTFEKLQTMSRKTVKHQCQHAYSESIANVRRIMFSNVAFPTTVAVLFIAKLTTEVLLSSCGSITSRYFNWSGARSGLLLGCMSSIRLPLNMHLATERDSTERRIMKVALEIARYGLWLMLNYESLFLFATAIIKGNPNEDSSSVYAELNNSDSAKFDGIFGAPQYILSFAIVFCSTVMLESSTLNLMSKAVAPRNMNKYSIDNAFVAIFVSALGRLLGCSLIFAVGVSSWTFFNEIVNSLCFSLIICCTAGLYIVKKHFFFLM